MHTLGLDGEEPGCLVYTSGYPESLERSFATHAFSLKAQFCTLLAQGVEIYHNRSAFLFAARNHDADV